MTEPIHTNDVTRICEQDRQILQLALEKLAGGRNSRIAVAIKTPEASVTFVAGGRESDKATPSETRIPIAGINKGLVAAAVLKMVEEGSLDLDVPATEYLPAAHKSQVTIRQLLSHTSGVCIPGRNYKMSLSDDEGLRLFALATQTFLPGSVFSEEALNHALLGLIVKRIKGAHVNDLIQRTILNELGISVWSPTGCDNNFWSATASSMSLKLSDLARVADSLFQPLSHASRIEALSPFVLAQLRHPSISLPEQVCPDAYAAWTIAHFGLGFATLRGADYALYCPRPDRSVGVAHLQNHGASVAFTFDGWSVRLSCHLLALITAWLSGSLHPPELPQLVATSSISFTKLLGGLHASELAGLYVRGRENCVGVKTSADKIKISFGPNDKIILGRMQRDQVFVQSRNPVPVGFFACANGDPGILLGTYAFRKLRRRKKLLSNSPAKTA